MVKFSGRKKRKAAGGDWICFGENYGVWEAKVVSPITSQPSKSDTENTADIGVRGAIVQNLPGKAIHSGKRGVTALLGRGDVQESSAGWGTWKWKVTCAADKRLRNQQWGLFLNQAYSHVPVRGASPVCLFFGPLTICLHSCLHGGVARGMDGTRHCVEPPHQEEFQWDGLLWSFQSG